MGIYRPGFSVFTETLVNEVEFVFVNILSWRRARTKNHVHSAGVCLRLA